MENETNGLIDNVAEAETYFAKGITVRGVAICQEICCGQIYALTDIDEGVKLVCKGEIVGKAETFIRAGSKVERKMLQTANCSNVASKSSKIASIEYSSDLQVHVEDSAKWFSAYSYLPIIVTVFMAIMSLGVTIYYCATMNAVASAMSTNVNSIGMFFILAAVDVISCVFVYFVLKILCSKAILKMYYLSDIRNKLDK